MAIVQSIRSQLQGSAGFARRYVTIDSENDTSVTPMQRTACFWPLSAWYNFNRRRPSSRRTQLWQKIKAKSKQCPYQSASTETFSNEGEGHSCWPQKLDRIPSTESSLANRGEDQDVPYSNTSFPSRVHLCLVGVEAFQFGLEWMVASLCLLLLGWRKPMLWHRRSGAIFEQAFCLTCHADIIELAGQIYNVWYLSYYLLQKLTRPSE